MDIYQLYANRHDYPDLDYDKAGEHLSQAIRCRTVSHVDPAETNQIQFERLHQLIRELPDGYRTVINLFVFEGYPHKKIAELLNITASTSASQLYSAKRLLAKKIKDYMNER